MNNIVPLDHADGPHLHAETRSDFLCLQEAARQHNLELTIASGYRDYRRQREIWNRKAAGQTPLRNERGEIIPTAPLSPKERVLTILRWSALPGFSRHHWGSDLDVYDSLACSHPQLLPDEYQPGGPNHPLFLFLQKHQSEFNFFHPYDLDRGGISPEPWHISHHPVAHPRERELSLEGMKDFITRHRQEILLSEAILAQAETIFERFVRPS